MKAIKCLDASSDLPPIIALRLVILLILIRTNSMCPILLARPPKVVSTATSLLAAEACGSWAMKLQMLPRDVIAC